MQKGDTNKLMEEKENLERRLNQAEQQLKEEQEKNKKLETKLEDFKEEKEMKITIENLKRELQQTKQERQKFEDLSNTQKDATNKLMEEKENLLERLKQAEQQLEAERKMFRKLQYWIVQEMDWVRYLNLPSQIEYDWSEMVGLDAIKKEIREKILEPLTNPDKQLHKRVLFHGPSLYDNHDLINATAKFAELCVFWYYSYHIDKKNFKAVISLLRAMQPVIVQFRADTGLRDINRLVNEIKPEDKIIVMVNTHKNIDSDFFSLKIEIPLPDKDRRIGIMKKRLEVHKISDDIDWDELSNQLEGVDFFDLRSECFIAYISAKFFRGDTKVRMKDFGCDQGGVGGG